MSDTYSFHSIAKMAVDPLSSFMNKLLMRSDQVYTVTIISDNAKRMERSSLSRRRAIPRRSMSTPLHHMSRWEAPSKFVSNKGPETNSAVTSPVRISKERISRWESMSTTNTCGASGLVRPTRQGSDQSRMSELKKYGLKNTEFRRVNDVSAMSTRQLPISLRSLPY